MAFVGRLVAVLLGLLAVAGPSASLSSRETLAPAYDQGIARTPDGWIVSGNDVLARLDEHLQPVKQVDDAIPAVWAKRGYDHIGDIDVSGTTLYVPFEQPNYEAGHQVMARYDAGTLAFRDAKIVNQHENSFVTVDSAIGHRLFDGPVRRRRAAALRHPRGLAPAHAALPRHDAREGPGCCDRRATRCG